MGAFKLKVLSFDAVVCLNFLKLTPTTKIVSISYLVIFFISLLLLGFVFYLFIFIFGFRCRRSRNLVVSSLIFSHTFCKLSSLTFISSFFLSVVAVRKLSILCTMTPLADTLRFNVPIFIFFIYFLLCE